MKHLNKGKNMKHFRHFLSAAAVAGGAVFAGAPESAGASESDGRVMMLRRGARNICVHPEGRRNDTKDNTRLIFHRDACRAADARLGFRLENHSGGYKVIRHPYSGKCVHPRGGDNPKEGAELVLYGKDCGLWKTKFKIRGDNTIQHAQSKKCVSYTDAWSSSGGDWAVKNGARLLLRDCSRGAPPAFNFEPYNTKHDINARIFHYHSGLCVHPKGRRNYVGNDTRLILHSDVCEGLESRLSFVMQENGSILHPFSRRCFHPKGGSTRPKNDTPLVLYDGCNHEKNKFKALSNGAIKHVPSGKCIHPKGGRGKKGVHLVLYDGCSEDRLRFDIDQASPRPSADASAAPAWGRFMHTASGSCIQPKGGARNPGNGHPLAYHYTNCRNNRASIPEFEMLDSGAIRHRSGKCIHPKGGKLIPKDGTVLHLYDGCRARYIQFEFNNGLLFHANSGLCVRPKHDGVPLKSGVGLVLRRPNLSGDVAACSPDRFKLKFVPTRK